MNNTYKCLASNLSEVEKRVKTISKKLNKYNIPNSFKVISTSVELVPVAELVMKNGYKEVVTRPSVPMEVVTYSFTMDRLQLGNYTPVAVIKHVEPQKNMVYTLDPTIVILDTWTTMSGECSHCNSKRSRKTTVILQDNNSGEYIQVGKSCLKEFTGIEASDVLSVYADLNTILIGDEVEFIYNNGDHPQSHYVETVNYLAKCIDLINGKGYTKEIKSIAFESTTPATDNGYAKAQEVIEFFSQFKFNSDVETKLGFNNATFYWNIIVALSQVYTKTSGFVAYAYNAYNDIQEKLKLQKQISETKLISQFQFNIGDKVVVEVTYVKSFNFTSYYGPRPTTSYIHMFKDINGNVFKWSTSKPLTNEYNSKITLQGTVKQHDEYKNEKQTILTRCKLA